MLNNSWRRAVVIGGFLVAAAAAPVVGVQVSSPPAVSVAQGCQGGEEMDVYSTTCVPFLVPHSPPMFTTTAANPDIPEIDGIPCTGHNSGQCIGLAEDQAAMGPPVQPRSTISSSP
ncbi:hypothetical protein H7J88_22955 [Mycolicibacterium flavescens]|uniref:Intersectin-EH binding protein Ibp1 n=1 Tax=Mycolicibacterium flavescens TaxID=1776 RepID=A0A1E3RJX2_MYCFV|nr:hypothetical protein [Mycolicibacterium flavescens]MCV7282497.1 hypothetical protein [Mycolicibacterium flavescens]ODQ90130.1 hypothetical protein BHQ18_11870 [Mycolicibacterium flavescens]